MKKFLNLNKSKLKKNIFVTQAKSRVKYPALKSKKTKPQETNKKSGTSLIFFYDKHGIKCTILALTKQNKLEISNINPSRTGLLDSLQQIILHMTQIKHDMQLTCMKYLRCRLKWKGSAVRGNQHLQKYVLMKKLYWTFKVIHLQENEMRQFSDVISGAGVAEEAEKGFLHQFT